MTHERYIPCPNEFCKDGIDYWENPETGIVEKSECADCYGQGIIENVDYWAALLPKVIDFKEGRESLLEAYDLKRGKEPLQDDRYNETQLERDICREMYLRDKP